MKTRTAKALPCLLWICAAVCAPAASAAAPEWLRALAREPVASYPAETIAVILLDERIVSVDDKGQMKTLYRRAYRILRPEGRELGYFAVHFDLETKLTFMKAWTIPAAGKEYEVKEKDAVEIGQFGDMYSDLRSKVLRIPAAEPGNVIGYEYEQAHRPYVYEDRWLFQDQLPVRRARFVLQLAPGWEFRDVWFNHPEQKAQGSGSTWVWELRDLPGVEIQPEMPPWRAVAGWMAVRYFSSSSTQAQKSHSNWSDMGAWYSSLTQGRRQATPEIKEKVAELTANAPTTLDKMKALAAFAQRDIRYVAIEIGIGGLQPHAAAEIFKNRYGDCKDKATILSSMLGEIGIESYYVLINTNRGVVTSGHPPALAFNHVILAMRLPDDVPDATLFSAQQHAQLGRVLYFDPTDDITPLGHLPTYLQANHGLLVAGDGGELVGLPLQPPPTNRLYRVGKLTLSPAGTLSGDVQEVRWGAPAASRRSQFLNAKGEDRQKVLESFLTAFLGGFLLTQATAENLERFDETLVLHYGFTANNYAKRAGNLMMVRPRVLGQKSSDVMEGKERKYPVEFDALSLETDMFEITLPPGYKLDELPPPVEVDYGFAAYRSKVELDGSVLRYQREYQVKEVKVPTERLADLKKFYRQIAADERASAVLQRTP